jgi:hypothetical protein
MLDAVLGAICGAIAGGFTGYLVANITITRVRQSVNVTAGNETIGPGKMSIRGRGNITGGRDVGGEREPDR